MKLEKSRALPPRDRTRRPAPFGFALSTAVPYAESTVPGDIVIASAAK
jgi:hypothetical protein